VGRQRGADNRRPPAPVTRLKTPVPAGPLGVHPRQGHVVNGVSSAGFYDDTASAVQGPPRASLPHRHPAAGSSAGDGGDHPDGLAPDAVVWSPKLLSAGPCTRGDGPRRRKSRHCRCCRTSNSRPPRGLAGLADLARDQARRRGSGHQRRPRGQHSSRIHRSSAPPPPAPRGCRDCGVRVGRGCPASSATTCLRVFG